MRAKFAHFEYKRVQAPEFAIVKILSDGDHLGPASSHFAKRGTTSVVELRQRSGFIVDGGAVGFHDTGVDALRDMSSMRLRNRAIPSEFTN
jgi:hypothetical protein